MKRIMAIYDVDPFYADRFAEFANQREAIPFIAVAFTSISRLKSFADQQPVELLLVGDDVGDEELKDVKVGQIVRLSGDGMPGQSGTAGEGKRDGQSRQKTSKTFAVGSMADKSDEKKVPVVYKYQSSDAVLREVMACYQVWPEHAAMTAVGTKSFVIGVYSPVNRCGKSGFCLTLGQILAKESHVLCLNLEEYSAMASLTGVDYQTDLTDLIYYYRQGEYSRMRLGAVVHSWGELEYVPPVIYAEDLAEITGEELAGLAAQIASDGSYDTLLLDMGTLGRSAEPLLELCNIVYVPVKDDCISTAKIAAWKEYLHRSGRGCLWEKMHLLRLPMPTGIYQAGTYLEQLLWGEMGDFVRNLIKGMDGGLRS